MRFSLDSYIIVGIFEICRFHHFFFLFSGLFALLLVVLVFCQLLWFVPAVFRYTSEFGSSLLALHEGRTSKGEF